MMATKMDALNTNVTTKNFDEIFQFVKKTNFFSKYKTVSINNQQLRQIYLRTIDLPVKLKFYADKQNIFTLEHLLNTETKSILRNRNIGERTIVKARTIIINYLNKIGDCLFNTRSAKQPVEFEFDYYFIGKYFPLLKGIFLTNQLYIILINEEISRIKLPQRLNAYISNNKLKRIYDLLNVNYDDLINEKNIGHKTIGKLRTEIIRLLNLREVRFLS